jgi:hypothetical protein
MVVVEGDNLLNFCWRKLATFRWTRILRLKRTDTDAANVAAAS